MSRYGFTPQGRVLTAEENYGFVPGGPQLEAEMTYGLDLDEDEDFGFVPGGPQLEAEMTYGLDLDEDEDEDEDFGFVPGGPQLEAAMAYGAEELLEDVALFGEDSKSSSSDDGDSDDAALEALEAELDDEGDDEAYGEDPAQDPSLRAPGDTNSLAPHLGDILYEGFEAGFNSVLPDAVEAKLKSAGKSLKDFVSAGDMAEIASAAMADPAFAHWNTLSAGEQSDLLRGAVGYCVIPGTELNFDDAFMSAWNTGGIRSLPHGIVEAVRAFFSDSKGVMWSTLNEIPGVGELITSKGLGPDTFDQQINTQAMVLYMLGAIEPQIYDTAASYVTQHGQDIVDAVASASGQVQGSLATVTIHEEALVSSIQLPEPAQSLPEQGIGLLPPPQVLAIGYGVAVAGSLLGIFR